MSQTISTTSGLSEEQSERIADVLREFWGFDSLRPLQEQAIACALNHRDSLLVMPTGGGKSLCYQIPPLIDQSVDVVVSPLISLMKDQVDSLAEAGVAAVAIHSGLGAAEFRKVHARINSGEARLLFVSPERLVNDGFVALMERLKVRRFAIDEAHCISQWGHDFRPEYRQLAVLRQRFPEASFHAFTATATPRVREDITEQLQLRNPMVFVGDVDRTNLVYRVLPKIDMEDQTMQIVARHMDEAVIVYCLSRKETEDLAKWLTGHGVPAQAYHAGMTSKQRQETQEAFASERLNVVVATVAFGMGIDRSNVRCVIHTSIPKSIENYQQETGRAGRDGLEAECVLLYSAGDYLRLEGLIRKSAQNAQSPQELIEASVALLEGMSRLASAPLCRHRALTEYFGQTYSKSNCLACDVCLDEVECIPDSTVLAQKIVSCVARAQQRFGVGQIVDILIGAETDNVRRFGHAELSTYGLLKDLSKKTIVALVYQLVDQKILSRSDGDYPVLKLNQTSVDVMKGQREVKLIEPKKKATERTAQAEADFRGVDHRLFQHLRNWRRLRAASLGHAPYMIFADTTLLGLARIRPTDITSLMLVPGIGQKKADDFGQAVCDEIATYCGEHSLSVDQAPAASAASAVTRGPSSKQRGAIREAFDLFDKKLTIQQVARALARKESTVSQYLEQFILETHPSSIAPWVDAATLRRVCDAIGTGTATALKPIFEKLSGEVSYEIIRIVLGHLRANHE